MSADLEGWRSSKREKQGIWIWWRECRPWIRWSNFAGDDQIRPAGFWPFRMSSRHLPRWLCRDAAFSILAKTRVARRKQSIQLPLRPSPEMLYFSYWPNTEGAQATNQPIFFPICRLKGLQPTKRDRSICPLFFHFESSLLSLVLLARV
jgi:hypothetical protein